MSEESGHTAVLQQIQGEILLMTINRPEVRNAVNLDVAEGIASGLERLDGDDQLRVGILTGAGKGFCSGLDLSPVPDGPDPRVGDRGFAGITQRASMKPLIAAVEGFALAGGFEIAVSCDLIVAGEGAQMGIPEVKRSLVANAGGLLRLPRQMPYHVAMEMALTGDPVPARRLFELGVVNQLAEDGKSVEAAFDLAERIIRNAPLAVDASKEIVSGSLERPLDECWAWQDEISDPVFQSEDAVEGARAFLENRTPVWRGR